MNTNSNDNYDNNSHIIANTYVKKVMDVLAIWNLYPYIFEFSQSTKTAQDAASALGCDVAHIAKSLIFKTDPTHEPILVLVSGRNRVCEKKLEKCVGKKIIKADAVFVKNVTGFVIGGIPPFGHDQCIEYIFIDETLLSYQTVWVAAGTSNTVFQIKLEDLIRCAKGSIVDIACL